MPDLDKPVPPPMQAAADVRARAQGVAGDGRNKARTRADNVWQGARDAIAQRHGEAAADRLLPLESASGVPVPAWDLVPGLGSQARDVAIERERLLVRSEAMGASEQTLTALEGDFHASVAAWLNIETRSLPTAAQVKAAQLRETAAAWRRP